MDELVEVFGWNLRRQELLDFANQRAAQKAKFGCEFFVASWDADGAGEPFASFFQHDREGVPKGIVLLNLDQEKNL